MQPATISLTLGGLLAALGFACEALPAGPVQQLVGASGSLAPNRLESQPVVREERDANKKKEKKKKPEKKNSFERECLQAHNNWRKLHQAEPLVWDKKITEFSRKRANFIADSDGDEFKHPDDLVYGENLAWHSRETTSCSELIKMWYDEVSEYDFNKAKFDHETGHFTQLVWRSTRSVGCARATSVGSRGGVYLVCNYDPPGNFLGEEPENVLPAGEKLTAATVAPTTAATTVTTTSTTSRPTSTASSTAITSTTSQPTTTSADATSGGVSVAKKKNKNKKKQSDKNKRKKKGNKNKKKKKKKQPNKKKQSGSTTTSTAATPTG